MIALWLGILGCGTALAPGSAACVPPVVLAAADLQFALSEVAVRHGEKVGCTPLLSFGSTGSFTTQIEQGGRADVFFAANESFVDRLQRQGLIVEETRRVYAIGRIVLVAPPGREPPASLEALAAPTVRYIAIANPEHAPYGAAAQQALTSAGLWASVEPRLVRGENIAQTWQVVETGNADAGIVALSVALSREGSRYTLIDDGLHAPLVQAAAVPSAAEHPAEGRAFLEYVGGPEGRATLKRYGFVLPGE